MSGEVSSGGTATITVTGVNAGSVSVNSVLPFVAAVPVSFTVTAITVGPPAQVVLTGNTCGSSINSGATCTITATIEDASGNPETTGGSGITFAEGGSDTGSVTLSGEVSSGGTATITATGVDAGSVTVNSVAPFAAATPVSFNVSAGTAAKVVLTVTPAGTNLPQGHTCTVTATIERRQWQRRVHGWLGHHFRSERRRGLRQL